jgi:hypothetical protein
METDQIIYVTNAKTITIERVPNKGLVRIKVCGEGDGPLSDTLSLTVWGDVLTMPEIIDTTSAEPARVLAELGDEEVDI